jgi:hypothetical protein
LRGTRGVEPAEAPARVDVLSGEAEPSPTAHITFCTFSELRRPQILGL